MKPSLFGKTRDELATVAQELSLPRFAAGQMADWLYKKRVGTIAEMTNLSKAARAALEERFVLGVTHPLRVETSRDGTRKYLFEAGEGGFIETAMIPFKERRTVCVSSQVGCRMGCQFCATGKQGIQGQLTAGEILNQIRSIEEANEVSNIVYMGMGEPLDNLEAVLKSIQILTAEWGFAMSPRRITLSSIGILPQLTQFLEESQAHLAISLHSPFPEERAQLVPMQKKYAIEQILSAIRQVDFSGQRRVSFEYILFHGINDSPRHAKALVRLLSGLPCRVNLIRFHAVPGVDLPSTDETAMQQFKDTLNAKGLLTTIRASRGEDIRAACGLLSTQEKKAHGKTASQ